MPNAKGEPETQAEIFNFMLNRPTPEARDALQNFAELLAATKDLREAVGRLGSNVMQAVICVKHPRNEHKKLLREVSGDILSQAASGMATAIGTIQAAMDRVDNTSRDCATILKENQVALEAEGTLIGSD